jgi:hypothetical protein
MADSTPLHRQHFYSDFKMAITENAFPENVSAEVKELMTKFMYLSNAASAHTEHEKSVSLLYRNMANRLDEMALAQLFTADGVYRFADQEGKGPQGDFSGSGGRC